MSSDADDCNCPQALRLQSQVTEFEEAIERCWNVLPINHGELSEVIGRVIAELQARIDELERALDERHTTPELAAEWARRGYRMRVYEGTRAGCMWCTELYKEQR